MSSLIGPVKIRINDGLLTIGIVIKIGLFKMRLVWAYRRIVLTQSEKFMPIQVRSTVV